MKKIAAIGSYEGAPAAGDAVAAVAKLEALLAPKGSGDILSAAEAEEVKAALAEIGAANAEWSVDNAWIANEEIPFEAEGAGIKVAAKGELGVCQPMDRNRMMWNYNMDVKKVDGADALKIAWTYHICSFGYNDVTGEPSIILDRVYTREVKDEATLAKFNAGEFVGATKMDFTAFKQWGLYAYAKCLVTTNEGEVEF